MVKPTDRYKPFAIYLSSIKSPTKPALTIASPVSSLKPLWRSVTSVLKKVFEKNITINVSFFRN